MHFWQKSLTFQILKSQIQLDIISYPLSRWAFTKVQSLGRRVRQAASPLPWSLYQCCSWPTLGLCLSACWERGYWILWLVSLDQVPGSPVCGKEVVPSLLGWLLRHFICLTGGFSPAVPPHETHSLPQEICGSMTHQQNLILKNLTSP